MSGKIQTTGAVLGAESRPVTGAMQQPRTLDPWCGPSSQPLLPGVSIRVPAFPPCILAFISESECVLCQRFLGGPDTAQEPKDFLQGAQETSSEDTVPG